MSPIQQIGPASTPQLYLENEYQVGQQRVSQRYKDLQQQYQRQQVDYETAAKEIADMQAESDTQTEAYQSNIRMMQQSQKFTDLGLISPEENQEAMWAQILPRELHQKMYPKEVTDPQRVPFSPEQMQKHQAYIEEFATSAVGKRYGWFGVDRFAKDRPPTQKLLLEKYNIWKINIGYDGYGTIRQGQLDNEWDAWVIDKYNTKEKKTWNPEAKEVLAARGKGPLTKDYGAPARKTPTRPGEGGDPMADSIAADLSKRRKPEPKPKPEPQPRIWARNRKTKKRMYSDDGGTTWQAE